MSKSTKLDVITIYAEHHSFLSDAKHFTVPGLHFKDVFTFLWPVLWP